MGDTASKYDRLAEGFAESSYANLEFYMHRRFIIATYWGIPLRPGDSILELGCGDGYLAQFFVQYGLSSRGVDISPKMVSIAERRLREHGLTADFVVADVSQISLSEPYDAVVSYMRAFFTYVRDPLAVLKRFRQSVRKKIIVDVNPRQIPLREALAILRAAGFRNVAWRLFFIPQRKKLPTALLKAMAICEDISLVRALLLHWRFHCFLKGEP